MCAGVGKRYVNLRLDEDLLAEIDAEAERRGQTRTMFVTRAVLAELRRFDEREEPDRNEGER